MPAAYLCLEMCQTTKTFPLPSSADLQSCGISTFLSSALKVDASIVDVTILYSCLCNDRGTPVYAKAATKTNLLI